MQSIRQKKSTKKGSPSTDKNNFETPEKTNRKAEHADIKIIPKSIVSYDVINQINRGKIEGNGE